MTKTRKYLKTAAQLLGFAALGWACRKAVGMTPAQVQNLRNRIVLSWNFFRATNVTGTIHRAEFDFIYLDGDRSAHAKQVAGLWTDDADQPDVLCPVPRGWRLGYPGFPPYDSTERRAMVLARSDRRREVARRTRAQIVDVLRCERRLGAEEGPRQPSASGWGGLGWEERAEEAYVRAFTDYPSWPSFASPSSLPTAEN